MLQYNKYAYRLQLLDIIYLDVWVIEINANFLTLFIK